MHSLTQWFPKRSQKSGRCGKTCLGDRYRRRRLLAESLEDRRVLAAAVPLTESFEVANRVDLTDWTFATTGAGWVNLDTASAAHSGTQTLRFDAIFDFSNATSEAVLELDLTSVSTATDLSFDFWMKRLNSSTSAGYFMQVDASGDGTTWSTLSAKLQPQANVWINYVYDLDEQLSNVGITPDADVFLRIKQSGNRLIHESIIDDVRVGQLGDVIGPNVASMSPNSEIAGPVSAVNVTFSEPINATTFTTDDIFALAADGSSIALTGDPVDSGDQMTFTLNFATAQALQGDYWIQFGPDVNDAAGNPMNQDQDERNGETIGDDTFLGMFEIGPSAVQTLPYLQDFEATDLQSLSGLSFHLEPGGTVQLDSTRSHAGAQSLKFLNPNNSVQNFEMRLDLSGQTTATDLVLDFWGYSGNSSYGSTVSVSASNDGESWVEFTERFSLATWQWRNYFYDLDAELDAASIVRDSGVYLRVNHYGNYATSTQIDNLRIANRDGDGPFITSFSPTTTVPAPLGQIQVTFNEPIDAASFTSDDVEILDVSGNEVLLASDPVDSGDKMTFFLNFATPQSTISNYYVRIESSILDLAGNGMNQDRDQVNSEPIEDKYFDSFSIGSATAQTTPYVQGFEVADMAALPGWSFGIESVGKISLTGDNDPASGQKHLVFDLTQSASAQIQTATLLLDLTSQSTATDLVLDYRLQRGSTETYITNFMTVAISGDGTAWTTLADTNSFSLGGYVNFFHDLDQKLADASIARDSDVYVRFTRTGQSIGRWISIDDVRVSNRDPNGPNISSISPTGLTTSPVSQFDVTFSEPIDVASFGADDIVINGPLGQVPVTVTTAPTDSGDQLTFSFSTDQPQTQPGLYRLSVGSQIDDVEGNPMNQDADQINGESFQDQSRTTFKINPTPADFPYFQGFEGPASTGVNWFFESSEDGIIRFSQSGDQGDLRMEAAYQRPSVNQAIVSIDLVGQSSVRVNYEGFNRNDIPTASDGVFISDDQGTTWYKAATGLATSSSWQIQNVNLDEAIAAAGMDYTTDFWIKIQHRSRSSAPYGGIFDNLFVESGTPITVSLDADETVEGTATPPVLTVSRDATDDLTSALELTLTNSDESNATIPLTATILAGQSSVDIPVTVIDDAVPDGPQVVTFSVANTGLVPRTVDLTVLDNEPATLAIIVDSNTISEAVGPNALTATLRRNTNFTGALVVTLASDDESEILVPPTVTIPDGQVETTFQIQTQNDYDIDGTQAVGITSTATGFVDGTLAISVEDDDTLIRKTIGGRYEGTLPQDSYEVLFDVEVPATKTWTIDPGSTLRFDTGIRLNIGGTVLAEAQQDSTIVLTSLSQNPKAGDWRGIDFNATNQPRSIFDHAEIAYATTGIDVSYLSRPRLAVLNSEIRDSANHGIDLLAGRNDFYRRNEIVIKNNRIHHNGIKGIYVQGRGSAGGKFESTTVDPTIVDNEIYNNLQTGISVVSTYSLGGTYANSSSVFPLVARNYIHDNGIGISVGVFDPLNSFGSAFTSGEYSNNLVANNRGEGFVLTKSGDGRQLSVVMNNTIVGNDGPGIEHNASSFESTVRNNLVIGNSSGIQSDSPFVPVNARVGFNNVFNNSGGNWVNYPATFGVATTTNINGTPSDTEFNISVDPQFKAGTLFELVDASLANDAGTTNGAPGNDYSGEFRQAPYDIGAYEHDSFTNVVTTLIDENDGRLGRGTGNSLREVIIASNARDGADTITFDPALNGGTIVLKGTPLPILSDTIVIDGPGAELLAISGNDQSRIFDVGQFVNATIANLTIRDAVNSAIYNNGRLTVADSVLRSNEGQNGGAINSPETLTIVRSTIMENQAERNGGGVYANFNTNIMNSTFYRNRARGDGGHPALGRGGGLYNLGSATVTNSTFSENSAQTRGGGIGNSQGTVLLRNSTVTRNWANPGTSLQIDGSGIHGGTITLHNSIVASNFEGIAPLLDDLTAVSAASTHNVIGNAATSGGLANGVNGNIVGVDALLAPLADNGGPTLTHALLNGSPAIDAGDNAVAIDAMANPLVDDQRGAGYQRIVDGNRSGNATVDIGAYETASPPVINGIVLNGGQSQRSIFDSLDVAFDQIIALDNQGGSPFELVNVETGQNVDVSAELTTKAGKTNAVLTFLPGPSVSVAGSLQDGNYRLTLKSDRILSGVMPLDSNGDGTGGDDYVLGDEATDDFFRLYGDGDGDRDVDAQDYGRFGLSFLKNSGDAGFDPTLDFDGDGDVDGQDYGRFSRNFLKRL